MAEEEVISDAKTRCSARVLGCTQMSCGDSGCEPTGTDDLVVIMAGYQDRMEKFFSSNPGISSRIAHHIDFPDYTDQELLQIAELTLDEWNYHFDPRARQTFAEYLAIRRTRPHFANARSVRNALDRIRLRQALRLFEARATTLTPEDLTTICEDEVRASRLFDDETATEEAPR